MGLHLVSSTAAPDAETVSRLALSVAAKRIARLTPEQHREVGGHLSRMDVRRLTCSVFERALAKRPGDRVIVAALLDARQRYASALEEFVAALMGEP